MTWYLLFGGQSADGRGFGPYVGRTTDTDVAKAHYEKCSKNPYSTGRVQIVTDKNIKVAGPRTNWDDYR